MRRIGAHFFDAFWHIFLMSAYFFVTVLVEKMRRKTGKETGPISQSAHISKANKEEKKNDRKMTRHE